MVVRMLRVVMAMGVHVPCAVGMRVFMFMEDDRKVPSKGVGDATEGFEARDVNAAFETRDHRLGHPQPRCQLLLRLAGSGTQFEQLERALGGERRTVVRARAVGRFAGSLFHRQGLSKIANFAAT